VRQLQTWFLFECSIYLGGVSIYDLGQDLILDIERGVDLLLVLLNFALIGVVVFTVGCERELGDELRACPIDAWHAATILCRRASCCITFCQ
jgi:hypothetical protein